MSVYLTPAEHIVFIGQEGSVWIDGKRVSESPEPPGPASPAEPT